MKKHLIAVAVAAAVAAPAMAQNVQVYGLIDASVGQTEKNGVKTTTQGNGDYLGSSALGFRGSEDLGGGMKASFQLEGDLNVGNGTGDADANSTNSSNYDGGLTFDRQSWVGISTPDFTVRVGRLADFFDTTVGYAQGYNLADVDVAIGSKNSNTTEVSGNVAGFGVTASYSSMREATATGAKSSISGSSPLAVFGVTRTIAGVDVALGYGEAGADNQVQFAAKTTLGAASIGVVVQQGETSNLSNGFVQATIAYPLGNGVTARASMYDRSHDTAASEFGGYAIMLQKDFSKRTSVYAGYRSLDYNTNSSDEKVGVIGLQHAF